MAVTDFELRESPVPVPGAGEILVRSVYLSIDPWLRALMNHGSLLPLDSVVPGDVVGCVVESRHGLYRVGDMVQGLMGWQRFAAVPWYLVRKIDARAAPVSTALGILGSSGLTAYFGLFAVGRPRPGETVVISSAGGAVGSAAAQLATLAGCRVIGIAGSEEKISYLSQDLGLRVALKYRESRWHSKLAVHTPFGVDVYFDNVGGPVSDSVLPLMNSKARVIVCGQIDSYDRRVPRSRSSWLGVVLEKRIRVEGFLVSDFAAWFPHALEQLARWFRAGLLRSRETVAQGLEHAPSAFVSMLHGGNVGKQLVKVD